MTAQSLPPDVNALLTTLDPAVRSLTERARELLLATIPKSMEVADMKARVIGYGYGTGYRDMVATLILSKAGVKIGLVGGAQLPDPEGLLAGKGKVHRHVAFTPSSRIDCPAVKDLLKGALAAWKARAATRA